MPYDRSVIAVIEAAQAQTPYCRACGTQTTIRTQGDRVLVECASADRARGRLGRLLFELAAHERVQVLP